MANFSPRSSLNQNATSITIIHRAIASIVGAIEIAKKSTILASIDKQNSLGDISSIISEIEGLLQDIVMELVSILTNILDNINNYKQIDFGRTF